MSLIASCDGDRAEPRGLTLLGLRLLFGLNLLMGLVNHGLVFLASSSFGQNFGGCFRGGGVYACVFELLFIAFLLVLFSHG